MAAVTAAIGCQVKAGDHIVAARALFGSCRWVVETLMPRYGVECTLVDGRDLDAWKAAMRPSTKVFFLESPTNPTLELCDIAAIADIAHEAGARLVVDNVFATPLWQSPLKLGADIVVYSTTKHIDGQGRCLGGIVLSDKEWIDKNLHDYFRHTGPGMSPFNAWVMLKGLETLPLRVKEQTRNCAAIADFLAEQPGVVRVLYPGRPDHPQADLAARQMAAGSTLVAFEVEGGKQAAFAFANALQIIRISNNLGDAKSLITHPATTTHKNLAPEARAELGISDGLLRLSVGPRGCRRPEGGHRNRTRSRSKSLAEIAAGSEHAGKRRPENDCREDEGERGETRREKTHRDEDGERLASFRKTGREQERLRTAGLRVEAALFRHHGIGEEACPVDVEREQQHARGNRIGGRIGESEGQRNEAVEGEIEHDVEISAEIGLCRGPRHRAVQAVAGTACKHAKKCSMKKLLRSKDRSNGSKNKARKRYRIGADA